MLRQVNLVVSDMAGSISFYRRLGLDIPPEAVWSSGGAPHHVEVSTGEGTQLELDSPELTRSYDPAWEGTGGAFIVFTLPTRDAVDATYAELTADGHAGHLAPFDAFWGARYAIVDDPDGNHVGLMSPSDPDRRSAPPAL